MRPALLSGLFIALIFPFLLCAQQQETRELAPFTGLKTSGSWNLIMKQGEQPSATLTASNIELEKVLTEVKDQVLAIKLDKGKFKKHQVEITVVYTGLQAISTEGSGDILFLDPLELDQEMNIDVSGSGNLDIPGLYSPQLNINQSGSGILSIHEGNVNQIRVNQSGAGDFLAGNLRANEVVVKKSGSGNTALGEVMALTVDASGSGDIVYQGDPKVEQIKMSGSGTLIQE
ncbi:head GIN domain-containing protein [Cyclobacterium plantarum]|uniref:DUF2807 domain-containing protein n=1 Tax=Cyclobacterium plantarum TaxID=2716263 RepID=A0ABX0H120_9BACT|nr:head GIN domain-containing protein [Cyclobacterium plantarum]NHE55484.1 DUF2807 domain-containing protein [Cyclobacterium plantarum]